MTAQLNEDGYSVKDCSYIYAPKGQAGEYAKLAANPYRGCGHKCLYCYVPNVLRMSREDFDSGARPRPDFLKNLVKDAEKYQTLGVTEQVMLSFTTDPYHPGNTELTRQTIEVLRDYGLAFCTLTKGGTRALRDIDLFRPERDAFACTLTTFDDDASYKWERGAAMPEDRFDALRAFNEAGIYTWVSLEPVFNVEAAPTKVEYDRSRLDAAPRAVEPIDDGAPLCNCGLKAEFKKSAPQNPKPWAAYFCARPKSDPKNCGFRQWLDV